MNLHIGKTADNRAFTLPLDIVTQTVAILARRGAGKSYTASVMAEELLAAKQQIVVLDPTGGWYGLRSSADGASDGFPVLVIGGRHGDIPLDEHAGEMLAAAIVEHRFSAIVDIEKFRKGEMRRFVTPFLETFYRLNSEPVHLFIDEADDVCPQRPFGDEAQMVGAVEDVVKRGRKKGIGCTLITQRPADLAKQVLTQVEMVVAMRLSHPLDMKAVSEWINVHADIKEAGEMMASLPSLPTGTGYFWSPLMDIFERVQVRERRTFDSGATPKAGHAAREPKRITKVDVEALGEKIKGMAAKAKENDPRELKATIRQLEAKLKAVPAPAPAVKQPVKEVPVLQVKELKQLEHGAAMLETCRHLLEEVRDLLPRTAAGFAEISNAMRARGGEQHGFPRATARVNSSAPASAPAPRFPDGQDFIVRTRMPARVLHAAPIRQERDPSDPAKLGKAERAILTCLIQLGPCSRSKVAVATGYASTGGAFNNAVCSLNAQGYIVREPGDMLAVTEAGRAARGPVEPLPDGSARIAMWMEHPKLGKAEREILVVLVAHYPNALPKEEVAQETESHYEPTGGTFNNAICRLNKLNLLRRTVGGVEATGELMGEHE